MTEEQKTLAFAILDKMLERVGGTYELTALLGIAQPNISQWRASGKISQNQVKKLIKIAQDLKIKFNGRKIRKEQLRPDIWA